MPISARNQLEGKVVEVALARRYHGSRRRQNWKGPDRKRDHPPQRKAAWSQEGRQGHRGDQVNRSDDREELAAVPAVSDLRNSMRSRFSPSLRRNGRRMRVLFG